MLSTTSLVGKLQANFPQFQFHPGGEFRWSPKGNTIYYQPESQDLASLLHELSHALLEHQNYTRDIQLLSYEQAAWQYAKQNLSSIYDVTISSTQIEESLNTYRDWLHARSTCPQCNATGLQIKHHLYSCLACRSQWQVNDARICELRRVLIHKPFSTKHTAL